MNLAIQIYEQPPRELKNALKVFKPPPRLTVSEWADKKRRLSSESSSEPGTWRTSRAEYQRGIMDALNDPNVEFVTLMTSSQIGKTELLINLIGYHIEHDPSPTLLIMPTLEMSNAWSKDRFAPMLRDTPSLRGRVTDAKAKDSGNTILHKTFPGGHITVAGANSPASLASRPVRLVLLDEVDRFPPSAGTEGDPVKIASKRCQTFWNRKIIHTSSPTVKGASRIESLYEESDQRHFRVPCPRCDHYQILSFPNIRWEKKGKKNDLDTLYYECEKCHAKLVESDKANMIARGAWRAEHPERIKHAGFHINELYSPWSTWRSVAENFLEAKKRNETLKVWVNTTLGETWEDAESYTISDEKLAARIEDYKDVPAGVIVLTAGVDVQDDRIECVVKGYGLQDESWFIDYKTFYGTPAKPEVWQGLDNYLNSEFRHESGLSLRITTAGIDSGGHFTQNVYQYVKPRQVRRIYAMKGMAGRGRPIVYRPSKNNKQRVNLFPVGVDTAKELIFARLGIEEFGPSYMHFSRKCDEEYFKQLTAEKQVTKYSKGFPSKVWQKVRSRNEALDCEVYALAVFTLLNANMKLLSKQMNTRVETTKRPKRDTEEIIDPPPDQISPRDYLRRVSRLRKPPFATSW